MANDKSRGPTGVRLDPKCAERTRAKIKVAKALDRLEKHLYGEIELSATQVASARILLDKSLPNLNAQDITSNVNTFVARLPEPSKTAADWSNLYVPSQPYSGPQTGEDVEPVPDKAKH